MSTKGFLFVSNTSLFFKGGEGPSRNIMLCKC